MAIDKETFNTWNSVGKLYEEKFMHLDIYNHTYDTFLRLLPPDNASVLDIGCGPGNISRYLYNAKPGLKISGMDMSPNMIELAKKNIPAGSFSVLAIQEIHTLAKKYDGIVAGFCIPYLSLEEVSYLIGNIHNLISENGIFYLSFVEGDYNHSGYATASNGMRTYFHYYKPDTMAALLAKHQFKTLNIETVAYGHSPGEKHIVIISKKL
ncbi:class I SAM-dependent DNA methyltransferase [Polluticaenibacter yanchengensis]|uniref:Class I SAM-dependent methyltransferase n=1 Tax=Polluticaenibacter yanchengensis TaxID=3014562 RepID=A0ABT4UMB6_9BACT|nr:class I SAM-dependent methyltransferase [Chitinophagaceae bacterium LY-5]